MRPKHNQSKRSDGFSVVELLVVIAIIGILMSMLLPALAKAREQAKTVQCMSQLRQIGQAIYSYAASNHGLTPAWSSTHNWPNDPFTDDPYGLGWEVLLIPYTGVKPDSPLYTCPASPFVPHQRTTYFMSGHWMSMQTPVSTSILLSGIKTSSQFIMVGECTTPRFYPSPFGATSGGPDDIDKDDGSVIQCLLFYGEPHGYNMHRAGNNILFADGHVATFKKFDPGRMTYSPVKSGVNWQDLKPE